MVQTTSQIPSLFVSHGAPTIALDSSEAHRFLQKMAASVAMPRAILVVSAHWETDMPHVSNAEAPETIHDFYGFPKPLYDLRYPAPGAPDVAVKTVALLDDAGMGPAVSEPRGLDHGALVPLLLGYPGADIPITQLSIQPQQDPAYHFRLGEALRPLRSEGVLILASGNLTHNLSEFRGQALDATPPDWVRAFDEWVSWAIAEARVQDLLDHRTKAPHAVRNHPTDEHLLPLFVALGAGSRTEPGRHLHKSYTYGVLAMDAYAFK